MTNTGGHSEQWKKYLLIGGIGVGITFAVGYWYHQRSNKGAKVLTEKLKEKGNALFASKDYEEAVKMFTKAIENSKSGEEAIVAMCYQNRAACNEKLSVGVHSILADCLKATELNPKYAKAYFRAAKHLATLKHYRQSLTYLMCTLYLDPSFNKTNSGFIDEILGQDIDFLPREGLKVEPPPVAFHKMHVWLLTWDYDDFIKKDLSNTSKTVTDLLSADERKYQDALNLIRSQKYDQVLSVFTENEKTFTNQLLRAKFLYYTNQLYPIFVAKGQLHEAAEKLNVEDPDEKNQLEAYFIFRLESVQNAVELESTLALAKSRLPSSSQKFLFLAALALFSGNLNDDENEMSDQVSCVYLTKSLALLDEANKIENLQGNSRFLRIFLEFTVMGSFRNDFSAMHTAMMAMEEHLSSHESDFVLLLLTRAYTLAGNVTAAKNTLQKIQHRKTYLYLPSYYFQLADVINMETQSHEAAPKMATKILEVEPYNYLANFMLASFFLAELSLGLVNREQYEKYTECTERATLFAPVKEQMMIRRVRLILDAKKDAAIKLGVF